MGRMLIIEGSTKDKTKSYSSIHVKLNLKESGFRETISSLSLADYIDYGNAFGEVQLMLMNHHTDLDSDEEITTL